MNIRKLTTCTENTLSGKFKAKKNNYKALQKTKADQQVNQFIQSIAKEIIGTNKKPILKVGDTDAFQSSTAIIDGYSGKLAITDSVWAPWSYIGKKTKK